MILALVLSSQTLVGCGGMSMWTVPIYGEGAFVEQQRALPAFDEIRLSGGMKLDIQVGGEARVVIHADENLQAYISTVVEDGVLRIKFEGSLSSDHELVAEIDVPSLQGLHVAGSSEISLGGLEEASFDLDIAGSARGTIEGKVQSLSVDIAGSSNLDMTELEAEDVSIDVAGSAKVKTFATRSLDVDVAGSAHVLYKGQPAVSVDKAGSATVEALPQG
jgi:hypothetical protein